MDVAEKCLAYSVGQHIAMMRLYRRLIVRHFGSTKNFVIWILAVIATIYVIDTYILTRARLSRVVNGAKSELSADTPQQPPEHDPKVIEQGTDEKNNPLPQQEPKKSQTEKQPQKPPEKLSDKVPEPIKGAQCGLKAECPKGEFAYSLQSGKGRDGQPTVCFNGHDVISAAHPVGKRGINIVVVNAKTMQIEDTRTFDTYQEDAMLIRFLKLGVQDSNIILAASMDEASYNLKDGKNWLVQYGSSDIEKLQFRDAFLMIGQRGLEKGKAKEKLEKKGSLDFAEIAVMAGCIKFPLGKITPIKVDMAVEQKNLDKAKGADAKSVSMGEELPNCGVKDSCGPSGFPVHLFTGKENSVGPKICVSGKYVLAKGLNDGGRGFNIVIVDPKSKDVVRVGHFDTYAEDSSNLEIFLEMMNEKEIILAVTHDDASKKLSDHAKELFNELGSGMIQNMKFRDVWGMAGQRGITGFGDMEQIEFAGPSNAWPRPIDKKMCVPTELKGSQIRPDPLANKNEKRRKFCSKYDGYGDFCETEHIDEALTPAPLTEKALENHSIFQVPIAIIPGLNHNAVRMQLETLLMNPGVRPDMVTLMFDEKFDEPAALAELFNFKTAKLSSSTKYVYQVEKALEKVWELYPSAKYVLVLEEEVILSPDFIYFMAQCLPAVDGDDSLVGVSAFNDNAYQGLASLPGMAYRQESFPGLGFLLKRSFYDSDMKGRMKECCLKRSWDGWFGNHLSGKEMIVPDVSRVYRRPYEGLSEQADFLRELYNRDRVTNLDARPRLANRESLTKFKYEGELQTLLKAATPLDTTNVVDCLGGRGRGFYVPETSGKVYSVFYEQSDAKDHQVLSLLCKCFHLFYVKDRPTRGLHNGLLRFTFKGNTFLFVGSSTVYYKHMPQAYKPVASRQIPAAS